MIKESTEAIIDIIYPALCVYCKKPYQKKENAHICSECYFSIKRHVPPFCEICGRGLVKIKHILEGRCAKCREEEYCFQRAWSVCSYEGLIKDLIHDFKYRQKRHYKAIFAQLFKEFVDTYKVGISSDIIIPIPLHMVRLREREYNQSFILAELLSELLQKPIGADYLRRVRNTKPQVNLDEHNRRQNIRGCFRVENGAHLQNQSILIVDDIFTTGATLSEAARMIKEYNPKTMEVVTLAS